MTLTPKLPPGRANRKALQFTGDIHTMRSAGYTFSAIRTALLDAGLIVSLTTVKREAARRFPVGQSATPPSAPATRVPPKASTSVPETSPAPPAPPLASAGSSLPGRAVAEEFMRGRVTNPLFLKEHHK